MFLATEFIVSVGALRAKYLERIVGHKVGPAFAGALHGVARTAHGAAIL
jgi:hypothetical protein